MPIKFTYTPDERTARTTYVQSVTIQVDDQSDVDGLLEAFESFVRAAGWAPRGRFTVEEPDAETEGDDGDGQLADQELISLQGLDQDDEDVEDFVGDLSELGPPGTPVWGGYVGGGNNNSSGAV